MTDLAVRNRNGGESLGLGRDLEPLRLMREMLGLDPFRGLVPLMQRLAREAGARDTSATR